MCSRGKSYTYPIGSLTTDTFLCLIASFFAHAASRNCSAFSRHTLSLLPHAHLFHTYLYRILTHFPCVAEHILLLPCVLCNHCQASVILYNHEFAVMSDILFVYDSTEYLRSYTLCVPRPRPWIIIYAIIAHQPNISRALSLVHHLFTEMNVFLAFATAQSNNFLYCAALLRLNSF